MPSSESATTTSPVTAPPRRANFSARSRLVLAALAARMFARIEQYIPVNPARPLHTAPTRKEITVLPATSCVRGESAYPRYTTTARTAASVPIVWYCRFRNASAPSRIAFEITCISLVPLSLAITARAKANASASARKPTAIAIHKYIRPSLPAAPSASNPNKKVPSKAIDRTLLRRRLQPSPIKAAITPCTTARVKLSPKTGDGPTLVGSWSRSTSVDCRCGSTGC